jgi:hypothetical protein
MIGEGISPVLQPLALPMPSLVQSDQMIALSESQGQIIPYVRMAQEAVEEQHRRLALIPPIQVV